MRMKQLCAFLIILFISTIPVFAQDQSSGDEHQPPSTADIVAKMQSKLTLTQDQVTAITPIIEKYSAKRQELRNSMQDDSSNKDDMRKQMKQMREDQKQELSQVLSADQLSQWDKMMAHKHGGGGNGQEGPSNHDGDNPPQNQD